MLCWNQGNGFLVLNQSLITPNRHWPVFSPVKCDVGRSASKRAGWAAPKMAGWAASKMAGWATSKMAGWLASKMAAWSCHQVEAAPLYSLLRRNGGLVGSSIDLLVYMGTRRMSQTPAPGGPQMSTWLCLCVCLKGKFAI